MQTDRRQFGIGLTAALLGMSARSGLAAQKSDDHPIVPSGSARPPYLFKNPTFEIIFLTSLGRAYHSGGNAGKVLYLTTQVEDGNFESAYTVFHQAGDEARSQAEESAEPWTQGECQTSISLGAELLRQRHILRGRLERSKPIPADMGTSLRLLAEVTAAFRPAHRARYDSLRKYRTTRIFHSGQRHFTQTAVADPGQRK